MADNNNQATSLSNDPAANAPDAAAYDKGKGKAVEDPSQDLSMDEESDESDNENEELAPEEEDEDENRLEPISADNILNNNRRTRGKNIDFQEAAEKTKDDEMYDDDDDEDFAPNDENDNEKDQMRD